MMQAWVQTLETVNIPKSFAKLGYLLPTDDGSHIFLLGGLPDYKYDPSGDFVGFVVQRQVTPSVAPPPAKRMKQSTVASFFRPRSMSSSSSSSASNAASSSGSSSSWQHFLNVLTTQSTIDNSQNV